MKGKVEELKASLKKSNESKDKIIQTNRELFQKNQELVSHIESLKFKLSEQQSSSFVMDKSQSSDYQL